MKANNGTWIFEGWVAYRKVDGKHVEKRWEEKIGVSRSFHQALEYYPKPAMIDARLHRWAIADKMAWEELPLQAHKEIQPFVAPLQKLLKPIDAKKQLIHGDIAGNLLFANDKAPAVIDFSPYWRPADFAIAILVVDALVWEHADVSLLDYVSEIKNINQLLIRALIGRIIQFDGLMREEGINTVKDVEKHLPLSEILMKRSRN